MSVVTRFAPSPTGFLHIGGARTALFNWLFARHHGGTFLLRIEDTDRARSTDAAVEAILDGLKWLGLDWDGDAVSQFERRGRHAEVAHQMVASGHAYPCYASPEELEAMRAEQKAAGQPMRYDGRWRDRDPSEAPAGVAPVVRLKAPRDGETIVNDHVQGEVRVQNSQLDDMVLLRADGTPTYMLSVVVDDHDMNVTHVVRGDDHLTNTFRQVQIYRSMGWDLPEFAHIPLIHGADGAKLSKRHGALGVEAYRDMGYLPEALRNYLLRLGWGHGDEEIIPTERAIEVFDLGGIGRSPSRFDFAKLDNLNGHYMRLADDGRLTDLITPLIEAKLGAGIGDAGRDLLTRAMPGLKQRAKTLVELAESAQFYVAPRPLPVTGKAVDLLGVEGVALLTELAEELRPFDAWNAGEIEAKTRQFAENKGLKLGKVAQPLRAALAGSTVSPPIFEVAELLGKTETLARIADIAQPR
ncbi:glutamyl-tRNA synthetase [Skermanella stibiiresistens SB22]|uniref:Glutamate--tRNA ligase n=1 Tax=Skermanella stibiiresistens SB22 TaxID=1385369 RepID=W9H825_9PROT|nr:glutamate--tRNA ligase [Skermanella stibiiresistens]EWY42154.1 glutamyl-tRNA synthetase [Skermanella stibiiresistens SB22]